MSDFLLVIPAGWTQLDWEFVSNNGLDENSVQNANVTGNMMDVEAPLKDMGLIPPESTVMAAKVIDSAYFMVKLA